MEPNTESKPEIIAEFNRRRIRQVIAVLPVVAIMIPTLSTENTVLGWIFGVILVIYIAFTFKNWRCPSCNGWLGKGISPNYCRNCGVRLQADISDP